MYCNALHALCNTCSKLDGFHICLTGTYSAFQFTHYHYFYFSPLSSALSFYHSHISPALTPSYVLSFYLTSEFFQDSLSSTGKLYNKGQPERVEIIKLETESRLNEHRQLDNKPTAYESYTQVNYTANTSSANVQQQ